MYICLTALLTTVVGKGNFDMSYILLSRASVYDPEPVIVNLLRSPGIESQPGCGGPVQQPFLSYRPVRQIGRRNRFLGSLNVYKSGLSCSNNERHAVLPTLFKIILPDWPKNSAAEKKIRSLCKNNILSLLPIVFEHFGLKIREKSSFSMHKGIVKATKLFRNSAPFRPFLRKSFPNSAADLSGQPLFS